MLGSALFPLACTHHFHDLRFEDVAVLRRDDDGMKPSLWREVIPEPLCVADKVRALGQPQFVWVALLLVVDEPGAAKAADQIGDQAETPRIRGHFTPVPVNKNDNARWQ